MRSGENRGKSLCTGCHFIILLLYGFVSEDFVDFGWLHDSCSKAAIECGVNEWLMQRKHEGTEIQFCWKWYFELGHRRKLHKKFVLWAIHEMLNNFNFTKENVSKKHRCFMFQKSFVIFEPEKPPWYLNHINWQDFSVFGPNANPNLRTSCQGRLDILLEFEVASIWRSESEGYFQRRIIPMKGKSFLAET